MMIPRALGGRQVDLMTFLRVAELMAEGDASVGWNLTNNVGRPADRAEPARTRASRDLRQRRRHDHRRHRRARAAARPCRWTAGTVVSGRWPFGSGCRESQWMLANFEVAGRRRSVRQNPDGTPALYRGFFHPAECTIIDNWDMTGMRGTGSHDWTVTDVFVPEHRTVHVDGRLLTNQWQRWPGTLYALPGARPRRARTTA